jgi:hypothetical protein
MGRDVIKNQVHCIRTAIASRRETVDPSDRLSRRRRFRTATREAGQSLDPISDGRFSIKIAIYSNVASPSPRDEK